MEDVLTLITMIVLLLLAFHGFGKCSSDLYSRSDFPEGFVFGAGISAYQWEGAVDEDGRKPSVWDTFLHCRKMDNGDIACDGYHKYKEDVQLMAETGLHTFRFSISWSRLISNGRGSINPKGLQFYKNFIQELVKHGIEPHVTLHHYDFPQYLEDDYGGWTNRKIIKDFTAYADVCFREFGNHVKFWTTINEANIFTIGGYNDGNSPPGRCSFPGRNCTLGNSSTETYIVGHNLLLAHASVSRLYKQKYKDIQGGSVGFSLFAMNFTPSTNSKDDEIATKRANDFYLGWMLEPLIYGDYPDVMKRTIGSRLPVFSKEESEQVKGSSDFIGVIHYLTALVTNIDINPSLSGIPDFNSDMVLSMRVRISRLPNSDEKCLIFFITLSILEYIKQSYGNPPVYILENGKTMNQDLELQQKDTPRIEYLDAYIGAVLKAVRNGSDTRGYFVWSFMDLYELLNGYKSSFGLYSVNFSDPHRKRSPKLSAHWYSGFLKGKPTFLGSQGITQLHSNFSSSR
ncbi:Glycosyl hydrolase superfamily protein [Arabidopsis thaliana]|uniref:Glycosyl hydrolase superfamily protein n=1 Tax=Arabidopsis thaliana TaxID=3702 RepID=UPI0001E92A87|nr:Glycosyl hydrolase superfamily protein [Arabidopsis thaliana]AEE32093.1 Glycosyl hydrolase superfamily protein [Arabidopsis thaliana]|eukprot:NP_973974.2 Glycosyl hydrolase superfamily protein [Arabidopsis thaliana]